MVNLVIEKNDKNTTLFLHSTFYILYHIMTRITLCIRYLLIINLITFIIRGIDKYKAATHKRRISEKNLLRCTVCGGRLGAVLGMQAFHHKTIKGKFLTKFRLVAGIWIIITILLLFAL